MRMRNILQIFTARDWNNGRFYARNHWPLLLITSEDMKYAIDWYFIKSNEKLMSFNFQVYSLFAWTK